MGLPEKPDEISKKQGKLDPSSMQSLQKLENLDLRRGFAIDRTKALTKQQTANSESFNPMASTTGEFLK